MRSIIASIEGEYSRYRKLGDATLGQLDAEQARTRPSAASNSVAMIVWHVAGNLESRFTYFLTTDGEKPWRDRESEFAPRDETMQALREKWLRGWTVLHDALSGLDDDAELGRVVTIRGVELSVAEALHRSLAHTAMHVGQMVYLGKMLTGSDWTYLSIPPGQSPAYNADPTRERAGA